MLKIILTLTVALSALTATADRREALLDSIEANNTTLAALRQQVKVGKAENRTTLSLADPNVDFGHHWGAPSGTPQRTTLNISQELDWGTLTGRRRKVMQIADARLEGEYAVQRQAILAEADQGIVKLTFYNKLCNILKRQTALAEEAMNLYAKKYAEGDIDLINFNKLKLNHSMTAIELKKAETERFTVIAELQRLNGGHAVSYTDTVYCELTLPPLPEFISTVRHCHPQIVAANAAISEGREQIKLDRSLAFPALSVGFAGEYVGDTKYNGLSLGVSLPLWGNSRKKVKQSEAALVGEELKLVDATTQLTQTIQQRYATALRLQQTADQILRNIAEADNTPLLDKALAAGRITTHEYLESISFYLSARIQYYEAERDARLALSELLMMLP